MLQAKLHELVKIAQALIAASQQRPSDTPIRPPASAMYSQSQRASVEPQVEADTIETFKTNTEDLSNAMGQLMAQAGRRAGKRRNR